MCAVCCMLYALCVLLLTPHVFLSFVSFLFRPLPLSSPSSFVSFLSRPSSSLVSFIKVVAKMVKLWDLSLRDFGLSLKGLSPDSSISLKGLTELISVDLGRNHFGNSLPEFDWSAMTHIAIIQFDDNGLTSLPNTFPGFGSVAANGRRWDICAINLKVRLLNLIIINLLLRTVGSGTSVRSV